MLRCMRTTLTLDDDVAALLQQVWDGKKGKLKDVVNEALRLGLSQMTKPDQCSTPYSTQPVSLGKCLIGSLDDITEALAVGEGEQFR